MAGFSFLHEKARRGALPAEEARAYQEAREDLAAMLLAAQRLTLAPGLTAREALRVVRVLPLELQLPSGVARAETIDLSAGGFSAVLSRALQPGESIEFSLQLAGGPVRGRAAVAGIQQHGGSIRVSFRLEWLPPADLERMATEVIDAALAQPAGLVEAT